MVHVTDKEPEAQAGEVTVQVKQDKVQAEAEGPGSVVPAVQPL